MSVKKITRVALLSAALYVAKVALEFLPNAELVSFLIIIYTLVFGAETLITIAVFNIFEFLQWGFGVWWVSYLYVWPLLCIAVLLLKKILKEEFVLWAVVSGIFGLLFGSFFALPYILINPSYALTYWISGLPWDIWHAAVNFILMTALGKPVYKMLKKVMRYGFQ